MDGEADRRSTTEIVDGMRMLAQSCEWIMDKGRELGPGDWVAA